MCKKKEIIKCTDSDGVGCTDYVGAGETAISAGDNYCNTKTPSFKCVKCNTGYVWDAVKYDCIKTTTTSCLDADGGKNYDVKGTTRKCYGTTCSFIATDVCKDTSSIINGDFKDISSCNGNDCKLEEYLCNVEGTDLSSTLYFCPNGCKDGACISVEEQGWDISIKIQKVEKRTNENALDWYYSFSVLGNRSTMPNFNLKIDFIYPNGEISIINIPHEPADMACGECPTQGGVFSLNPSRTGNYVFKIFADSENSVSEIKEKNNYDSLSFYWDGSSVGKVPFNCTDTDGLNIGKKGSITYGNETHYDFCRSGLVVEYYCVGDNDFSKTEYSCPIKGFSCINGECILS